MHVLKILLVVGLGLPVFFMIRKIGRTIDKVGKTIDKVGKTIDNADQAITVVNQAICNADQAISVVNKAINEFNIVNVNLLVAHADHMIKTINVKEINNIIENIDINKINNIIYNVDSTIETIEFVPIKKDIKFLTNKVVEFITDIVNFTLCIKKPNVIEA